MGWGTTFKPEIYLSREKYDSIADIEDEINDQNKYLSDINNQLLLMIGSDLTKCIPEDWKEEPMRWINNQVTELLSGQKETMIKIYQLELLKENYGTIEK